MSFKIVWTEEALQEIRANLKYLREEWTEKEVDKFIRRILEFEDLVTQYPFGSQRTKVDPNLRKGRIDKHVSAIYKVIGDVVHVGYVINNRTQGSKFF